MVGFLLCVVAVSAIWLIAFEKPKPLKLAPVPTHPPKSALENANRAIEAGRNEGNNTKGLDGQTQVANGT
jgi:hypothetical protein